MKRIINYLPLVLIGSLLLSGGCEKVPDEITTIDVSRLFSPVDLETRVVNKTSVRLSWNKVSGADSYDIELFENGDLDFSGTSALSLTGITFDQLPYVITDLDGDTSYSVRVKAVGEEIDDSKWVADTFKTEPEQIFQPVDVNDLEATSVTLRWNPGTTVSEIVLNPGNITHHISEEESSQGAATIEGLIGETEYTAEILNDKKIRGTITFTTLIDLGNAIQVNPGEDLDSILSEAAEGDVFALMPGEYEIPKLNILTSVTLQGARPAEKPVLIGTIVHLKTGTSLTLKDLIMDGTGSTGDQAIVYDEDGGNGALTVEGCEMKNYTKGLIYVNNSVKIASVSLKGNIIHDIECNGGDFIDFRKGIAETFDFTENTVYNSALARDLFRMDAGGSSTFPEVNSLINISNNTFYKFCDGTSRRVLYIRLANHEIHFNKNILAESEGQYSNQSATTISEMNGNNYFHAPDYTASAASGAYNDTGDFTELDPGFAHPDKGDFTVNNEELIFQMIGDPRWIK